MFTPELKPELSELKKMMDDLGICHPSKHFNISDDIHREIDILHIIGGDYLVLASDFFRSSEDVLKRCEEYNKTGKLCKENGIRYIYHNHAHEFQKFEGKSALEILVENTDPEYVNFEIYTHVGVQGR